jgi:hypothetical protein
MIVGIDEGKIYPKTQLLTETWIEALRQAPNRQSESQAQEPPIHGILQRFSLLPSLIIALPVALFFPKVFSSQWPTTTYSEHSSISPSIFSLHHPFSKSSYLRNRWIVSRHQRKLPRFDILRST